MWHYLATKYSLPRENPLEIGEGIKKNKLMLRNGSLCAMRDLRFMWLAFPSSPWWDLISSYYSIYGLNRSVPNAKAGYKLSQAETAPYSTELDTRCLHKIYPLQVIAIVVTVFCGWFSLSGSDGNHLAFNLPVPGPATREGAVKECNGSDSIFRVLFRKHRTYESAKSKQLYAQTNIFFKKT